MGWSGWQGSRGQCSRRIHQVALLLQPPSPELFQLLPVPHQPKACGSLTPMGALMKMQIPELRNSDAVVLRWGQEICIVNSPPT